MNKNKKFYWLAAVLLVFVLAAGIACCLYFGKSPSDVPMVSENVVTIPVLDQTKQVEIHLKQNGSTVSGSGASVSGNVVSISQSGTYLISGALEDGQICVSAGSGDTVILLLNGAEITNLSKEALYVEKVGQVSVQLADGTENVLQSGNKTDVTKAEVDDGVKGAALYSCDDLSITGTGSLKVLGYINNGIHTKKNFLADNGTIAVEACNHGINGKDSIQISGGDFTITAGGDGIRSDGTEGEAYGNIMIKGGKFSIHSGTDAVQAESALEVSGGDFNIVAGDGSENVTFPSENGMGHFGGNGMKADRGMPGGGREPRGNQDMPQEGERAFRDEETNHDMSDESDISRKGMKSGRIMVLSGGTFSVDSYDDAFHSNGSVAVSDGDFSISTGDDGIHADGELNISGGTMKITKSYEGLEGNQIVINCAEIKIVSSDDGVNAYGGLNSFGGGSGKRTEEIPDLKILGGTLLIDAEGDGIDSNGNLTIEGGSIVVNGPVRDGNGAIDSGSENDGTCTINGGTILALGSSGMAETFSEESEQCSFMHNFDSAFSKGSEIIVSDSNGKELYRYTAVKEGTSVVFSSPELKKGQSYILSVDGQKEEISMDSVSAVSGNSRGSRHW